MDRGIFFSDPDEESSLDSPHFDLSDSEAKKLSGKFGFKEAQIHQFLEAFSVFDKNCDGLITSSELGQVMTGLGHRPSLQELEALIRRVDIDRDGCVNFEEFLQMMCAKIDGDQQPQQELREVFDVLDLNQDGVISTTDLYTILSKLGENITQDEASEMVNMADCNEDGVVDFKEFQEMLHAK